MATSPLPSSGDAAIALKIEARFAVVTPSMPMSARSLAVKAGVGVPPAAVCDSRSTMLARLLISPNESTPPSPATSSKAFIS